MGRGKSIPRVKVACPTCGTVREWKGSHFKDYPGRPARKGYCSRKCGAHSRMNRDLFKCDQCGRLAPRKLTTSIRTRFCSRPCEVASRQGGAHLDKHGYRVVVIRGHQIPEHRIVMEGMVGRPLRSFETVHHKNGQRADNRRENLELWDSRNPKGQRISDKIEWAAAYLREHRYIVIPPPGWLPAQPSPAPQAEFPATPSPRHGT